MINKKIITVVLPAYNAESTLEQTYKEIPFDIVDNVILVDDLSSDKTIERAKIIRVLRNPVNIDYDRRKIITKSTIIETSLGEAVVTSHPGQDGLINAILVTQSG